MNDRARAISILKQARDLLAERLTERVLDASEEIMEDAEGLSYMGEIESMYEQMGSRLIHLNQMLSSLPPQKEPAAAVDESVAKLPPVDATSSQQEQGSAIVVSQYTDVPTLPVADDTEGSSQAAPISFQTFAAQIQAGEIEAAGHSLAYLFNVDQQRGGQCAEVFAERLADDPELFLKAMKLRRELQSDRFNGAILLLHQCFGLTGLESIGVMQSLRVQLSRGV